MWVIMSAANVAFSCNLEFSLNEVQGHSNRHQTVEFCTDYHRFSFDKTQSEYVEMHSNQ